MSITPRYAAFIPASSSTAFGYSSGSAIPDASAVSVASGATLNVAATETIGTLSGAGSVILNSSTTLLTDGNAANSFSGAISGSGSLTKLGTGTLILTGANSYTGGTTITTGTLTFSGLGSLGTGSVALAGGTLQWASSNTADVSSLGLSLNTGGGDLNTDGNTVTFASAVTGTGSLTKAGTGTLILTGSNTYSGGTTITTGTLQIGNAGTTGSIAGDVTDNGTLAFNRSDDISFAGTLSGSGSLAQSGTGTLTVNPFTWAGSVTVNAGKIAIGSGAGTSKLSSLTVTGGQFDTADNKLVFTGTTAAAIKTLLYNGRTGTSAGDWNGTGLISSTAAGDANKVTAIGWASAGDLGISTWGGISVSSTDLLTKYTYYGDANMDGTVTADDYALTDDGYVTHQTIWLYGDFNYDGSVTAADYTLLDAAYTYYTNNPTPLFLRSGAIHSSVSLFVPGLYPVNGLTPEFIAEREMEFGPEYGIKLNELLSVQDAMTPSLPTLPEPAISLLTILTAPLLRRRRKSN